MPNLPISGLTASASNAAATDVLPVVQTTGTGPVKMTVQQMAGGLLGSTTLSGATITADAPVLNMSQTWNNNAVTFTGLKFNAATGSNTGSAAASLLMDLQLEGVSQAYILKGGTSFFGAIRTAPLYGYGDTISARNDTTANRNLAFTGVSLQLRTGGHFGFTSGDAAGTADLFLTRRAAANLRLGAADAATPVAQTLSVQSVVTGTSNIAGGDFTITGSQSTGSGTAGHIVLQTASAGSSGTTPNGLSTIATFGPNTLTGSQTMPLLSLAQTWNTSGLATGIRLNIVNTASLNTSRWLDFQHSGTSRFSIGPGTSVNGYVIKTDTLGEISNDNSVGLQFKWSTNGIILDGNGVKIFSTSGAAGYLTTDANNTLALRNGANAQEFRVYGTTDGTNSEYLSIKSNTGGTFEIGVRRTGTGLSQNGVLNATNTSGTSTTTCLSWGSFGGGFVQTSVGFSSAAADSYDLGATVGSIGGAFRRLFLAQFIETKEMTAPASPAADGVRIYAVDNGSGKTQLMALFGSGVAQQIAIEP